VPQFKTEPPSWNGSGPWPCMTAPTRRTEFQSVVQLCRALGLFVENVLFANRALNQLKIAVGIGIRSGAYYFRVASGQSVLFLFDHLHQCFHAIGISTERAGGSSHGCSVHLHRFLFDVLVRFEMSVRPAALDRLLV
jgi:hypothetical protein